MVGRYLVLGRLGAGGMGVVLAAHDPELDRKVALKLLRTEPGSGSGDDPGAGQRRLLREAQAMARLAHPNVVTVHDVGMHADHVFVAMEFVEGKTLGGWLSAATRSRSEILEAFDRAGQGLRAAHAKGLVHRDFKPDNVMIGDDGRVRVMDFGLAHVHETAAARDELVTEDTRARPRADLDGLTETGALLGTPAYMAPEQHLGLPADARSDQFSFCVALYEALHGERPFEGSTLAALMLAVTQGKVRPPRPAARVPAWLRAVLLRGLSVQPQDRFPHLDALLEALRRDPTRRRRRAVAAAGVGLVAALGVGAAQLDQARKIAACDAAAASITEEWGPAPRDAIERAFAASDVPGAVVAFERVAPRLDAWAQEWARIRGDRCRAATIDATLSPAAASLSEACLDEARRELAARVELLARADATAIRRSVELVTGLATSARCEDDRWLAARPPLPEDPATREQVAVARGQLLRAQGLLDLARLDDAAAAIDSAATAATAAAWSPLLAEVALARGQLAVERGTWVDAERPLQEAHDLAGAVTHDEAAAEAATALASVVGWRLARHAEGRRWAALSAMWLERMGMGDHGLAAARRLDAVAMIERTGGTKDAEKAAVEQALEIRHRVLGPDHPDTVTALHNLALTHASAGRLDEALELNQRALEARERAFGPDHPDVAHSLEAIGGVHRTRGELDRAAPYFVRAAAIVDRSLGPDHPDALALATQLAAVEKQQGNLDRAEAIHRRILEMRTASLGAAHPSVGGTLTELGLIAQDRGNLPEALALHRQALDVFVGALGPDHVQVGAILNNIGIVLHRQGDPNGAIEQHRRALAIWEKEMSPDHPMLAFPLQWIARAELSRGRPRDAIAPLERAERLATAGQLAPIELANIHDRLARALWDGGGDRARARTLAEQALATFTAGGPEKADERAALERWLVEHPG
jgi:tetratricopeptide (TPR) repeat protein